MLFRRSKSFTLSSLKYKAFCVPAGLVLIIVWTPLGDLYSARTCVIYSSLRTLLSTILGWMEEPNLGIESSVFRIVLSLYSEGIKWFCPVATRLALMECRDRILWTFELTAFHVSEGFVLWNSHGETSLCFSFYHSPLFSETSFPP